MPTTTSGNVATITRWQIGEVVDTLHASFRDDPFFEWVFPDADQRMAQTRILWERVVSRRPADSRIWQASDAGAVAIWHAPADGIRVPDEKFGSWFRELLGDDLLANERFRFFGALTARRPVDTHWYLASIGTRPELQGTGIGTALMAPMVAQCDRDGIPMYLESTNPRNVAFYERLGFVELERIPVPDGSTHLTLMERKPS